MSFENTILSALIIATVLEVARFFARRLTKRYDITQEYRMEVVRRRLNTYDNTYKKLSEICHQIDLELNKSPNDIMKNISEMIREASKSSLFFSSDISEKVKVLYSASVNNLKKNMQSIDEKSPRTVADKLAALRQTMRKEIYKGKIESAWSE